MEDLARVYEFSTHSRLKAAGGERLRWRAGWLVSTHSRLKAAGIVNNIYNPMPFRFQHTAA